MEIPGLTDLERDVLLAMLAGHPGPVLRDQLESAEIVSREMSGVGFFLRLATGSDRRFQRDSEVTGIYADIPGVSQPVGFALFIRDGQISWLEGWTHEEPWPDATPHYRVYRMQD
jgi:hypothetical protein